MQSNSENNSHLFLRSSVVFPFYGILCLSFSSE